MKTLIALFLVALLCPSCLKTEVITLEEHEAVVEKRRKPEKPLPDHQPDTTETDERVPIGWKPSVEDWGSHDVTMQN